MRQPALLFSLFAITALVALLALPATAHAECIEYGTGVSLEEATPVSTLLADPESWAGETVRVEGEVQEVCPKAGCWLSIVPAEGASPLRVKVEDGEIVFPLSARGQDASAQGVVEVHDMSREQYTGWLRHLAEEREEEFDPETVGDGPYRQIQVKAVGAKLCPPASEG